MLQPAGSRAHISEHNKYTFDVCINTGNDSNNFGCILSRKRYIVLRHESRKMCRACFPNAMSNVLYVLYV